MINIEQEVKKFTLTIPLPSTFLMAQNRGNWRTKSKFIKDYREACKLLALLSKNCVKKEFPFSKKVRIDHTWYCAKTPYEKAAGTNCDKKYKRYRPVDEANAITSLKAAIDGIVDAGILADDRAKFVEWGKFERLSTHKQHFGRSEIVLRFEVVDQ